MPIPAVIAASRSTATRVTPGAISLEQLQPFRANAVFIRVKPVVLPPGRAKLSTKPAPTGSGMPTNTIGTVRVACSSGPTVALPVVTMTSGANATNSATNLRMRSASPAAQRVSIRTLLPSVQPNCAVPGGTPRCGPDLPDRPRPGCAARRPAASARAAARAPRVAMPPYRR